MDLPATMGASRNLTNEKLRNNSAPKTEINNTGSSTRLDTMPQRLSDLMRNRSRCECCPYGYHIDRDFVRYCETLYNDSYLDKLKQLKREKRRQHQSLEAYLGLTVPSNTKSNIHSHLENQSFCAPPPDLLSTNDSLRDAVLDFEETLQCSQKNSLTPTSANVPEKATKKGQAPVDLLSNAPHISVFPNDSGSNTDTSLPSSTQPSPSISQVAVLGEGDQCEPSEVKSVTHFTSQTHSSSSSSISSQSTVSSMGIHLPIPPEYMHGTSASQQMANTMATLTSAGANGSSSGIVGINKGVLTTIREQMATSLQRMRELEEQVKAIPVLQVRLSVLKEEKRLLLLQLRARLQKAGQQVADSEDLFVDETGDEDIEVQLKRLESGGIITPRLIRRHLDADDLLPSSSNEDLSSPALASSLSAVLAKKGFIETEVLSQMKVDENQLKAVNGESSTNDIKLKRNVGTACSVLTRDVGVSHVPERTRSIGIGGDIQNNLQALCIRCNKRITNRQLSISSSPESIDSDSESERNNFTSKKQILSCTKCNENKSKIFETKTTNTDNDELLKDVIKSIRLKKYGSLTFDFCGQASIPPIPQNCEKCNDRSKKTFLSVAVGSSHKLPDLQFQQISRGVNTESLIKKDGKTLTDLKMNNIVLKEELEERRKSYRSRGTDCFNQPKSSMGTQVSLPKLRTRDASTTYEASFTCSVGVQVGHDGRHMDGKVKIDAGVGNNDINNFLCNQCSSIHSQIIAAEGFFVQNIACKKCSVKETRNVGVGDYSVSQPLCERCKNIQTKSIGCGSFSIHDSFCGKCQLRQTETTGTGETSVTEILCDHCSNKKSKVIESGNKPPEMHSVGINTNLDSSSTSSLSSSLSNCGVRICDKCNATIQSVAQDFVQSTSDSHPQPPSTSRIPRLNIPLASSSENHHTSSTSAKLGKTNPPLHIKKTVKSFTHSFQTESSSVSFQNHHARLSGEEHSPDREASTRPDSRKKVSSTVVVESSTETSESSGSESSSSPVEPLSFKKISSETVTLESLPRQKIEPTKEMKAACKVLNDYLQKPERQDRKRISSSLNLIQQDWFKIVNLKGADPYIVEDYLDFFEEMSQALLHHIVNMTDNNGNTAMHYAVSYGNFDVVSILIESKVCDLNKQNKAGYTCMMLVSLAETKNDVHRHVVKRLFRLGDVNIKAKQNGQTALMLAASHKKLDIVKLLLEEGAEVNLQDNDGSTALMCAAEHGHMEIVQQLLASPDCDPSLTDNDSSNALSIAMEAGHRDIGLLIYANMNFSRGSSPYSSLKGRKRVCTPRSTPPARTPPLPSPSATRRSTSSLPQSLQH